MQAGSDPDGKAANLINRSGLNDRDADGLDEHSGSPDHMWLSAKGQTQGRLEFDLGEPKPIGTICIWNYNDTWRTDRGVRKADISIWTQENGWRKLRDDVPLEQAEGGDDYDEATIVSLDAVRAQKIRLDDLENFGDADHIGLSEVQFFRPRGPEATRPYPPDETGSADARDAELPRAADGETLVPELAPAVHEQTQEVAPQGQAGNRNWIAIVVVVVAVAVIAGASMMGRNKATGGS